MPRIFVLSASASPLMPCHPARARYLLRSDQARVVRRFPFTIQLTRSAETVTQTVELKIDPGSRTTGLALVAESKRSNRLMFAANLSHRGQQIKDSVETRRALRRSRRQRKTRYRAPRFDNRTRPVGWLPPSLTSRVGNIVSWSRHLRNLVPVTSIAVETVRFDTQKLVNPEISGLEYQQGELFGYEIREYLLEKWGRCCAYCGASDLPMEVEHIVPRSRGGTDRVSNLTLACRSCNQRKSNLAARDFVKDQKRLKFILQQAEAPLKDAAAINATRLAIGKALEIFDLPLSSWSGGRTKYNRIAQGYAKDHWIDAAFVGESGACVFIHSRSKPILIRAEGRGSRQKCLPDRYGFPRTAPKAAKRVFGFQTGDLVKAKVNSGKRKGRYQGRVAIRSTGNFNIKTSAGTIQGISHRYCRILQRMDGYSYAH